MKQTLTHCAIVLLLFTVAPAFGQSWGIGLRFGDPTGITIKRYLPGKAFELNIGRTRYWYREGWYDKRFYEWYEDKHFGYDAISYTGYRTAAPLAVQFHYLIQKHADKTSKAGQASLDWYYGFGGQMRMNTFYYNYRYKPKGGGDWIYVSDHRVPGFDLGVDAVLGLELKFKGPLSLFLDVNLFMELVDDPFLIRSQAGIGGRFRF